MTYINISQNQPNNPALVCPNLCIFNLGLKIFSQSSSTFFEDTLALSYNSIPNIEILYQNSLSFPNTSVSRKSNNFENTMIVMNYKNFNDLNEGDKTENNIPFHILQGSGNSQTVLYTKNTSFPRKFYLSDLGFNSYNPPFTNTSTLPHEGNNLWQTPNYSSLRIPSSNDPGYLYKKSSDLNNLKLPTIVLYGGYEYYIEITNSSGLIAFNSFTNIYDDQNRTKLNANSKVYINNNSYNPTCNISFYERKTDVKKYLDIRYIFADYVSFASQWASKIMIYQIPIV